MNTYFDPILGRIREKDETVIQQVSGGSTIIQSGGGGADTSDSGYHLGNEELTSSYAYVGYEHESSGAWYIYRRTRSSNARLYASGASSYATNWSNRSSLTYT